MPNSPKRIQCGFRPDVLEALESLSKNSGHSLSKVVSILVEQSLVQRGLLTETLTSSLPADIQQAVKEESAASEAGWKPEDGDMELLKKIKLLKELKLL